ncbi:hypothetical protein C8J30_101541 [Rhodobacter viridis]|uniref:Uncharacterized protein n=1 Tax=Rhodobacter viridis TaxID=1054202 RepID=A0A318U836_9RHOB|nr:hypothetical protein [Rhodobacter viridis]PYF13154.1 hypothetical protein C8J30_101541 [Rhodobacter viridis]
MIGPEAFARSLSIPSVKSKADGSMWQYHSRSDDHSKKACWLVMLDLLLNCPLLRKHVSEGKVYFGINHEMRDFQQNRKKDLDLVLCVGAASPKSSLPTFDALAEPYGIVLTPEEQAQLNELPSLRQAPVGSVLVALEAKACMTEHVKARPRLFDELNSSHLTIHGATDEAIAVGLVVVNFADSFISPGKAPDASGARPFNIHRQPGVTERVLEKVGELPRRSATGREGFDALAAVLVDCRNDGHPVSLVTAPPAPQPGDNLYYDSMILRIAQLYATRFVHH